MTKRGEANIQGMLIGILTIGAFFAIIAAIIAGSSNYANTDADFTDLDGLMVQQDISEDIDIARSNIDTVTVDKNLFDYFIGIFDAVLTPFKFIYRTFTTVISMIGVIGSKLKLLQPLKDYFITLITILIVIGVVMIKFYLGRKK